MSRKFVVRTLKRLISRKGPYLVHLAMTHRCNLRCHFCQVPESRFKELDLEGFKRIVDRLDALGVAVLGLMGGEPLLRPDVAELIDYAAGKGLYVKVTSNGTQPFEKYQDLLASRVAEIAISLDDISQHDSLTSHTGPRILATLRSLNDNLPEGKRLTITTTVSRENVARIQAIVDYCTREYPRSRLLVNTVVVGNGKQMVASEVRVNPDFMGRLKSPLLLMTGFHRQACQEYYASHPYNWGCLAGEAFFDVKPNGDLWMCQDQPSRPLLNLLDPDFEEQYRQADFSSRRECDGCSHLCYLMTQKGFEPRYWPEIARLWWLTMTAPDDPWRRTSRELGWLAGLLHFAAARARLWIGQGVARHRVAAA